MKSIEEQFGPCLRYRELEEPVRDLYEMAVDMVSQALSQARIFEGAVERPYPCFVGFPEKISFNAGTCDLNGGGSLVAINAAVPYLLFCACFVYSSRADTLTGLPVQKDEKLLVYDELLELIGKLPQKPIDVSDYFALFDQLCSSGAYPTANLSYTLFLYTIAIRFITMHEVMHVVLGHTAYMKKELQFETFLEFSSDRECTIDPNFLQCIEFIADRNAIRGIARRMVNKDAYFSTEAQNQLVKEAAVDEKTYLVRGIMTAATLMFHLFPALDETFKKPITSHPNPYMRSLWLAMELSHELVEECNIVDAIFTPFAHTAATLSKNFKCPGDWRSVTEMDRNKEVDDQPFISDASYNHVIEMATQWSNHIYVNYGPKFVNESGFVIPQLQME